MATSALMAVAATGNAFNLLSNPGFETGSISPWFQAREWGTNGIGQIWHATNTDSNTGSWSGKVESNKEIRQNFLGGPVSTALITAVSVWVKVPEISSFGIWLYYSDATEEMSIHTGSNAWVQYNVTANLDVGKSLSGFGVNGYSGGGPAADIVFADDGLVESAVPEPATLAALGIGAVAFVRRRRSLSK